MITCQFSQTSYRQDSSLIVIDIRGCTRQWSDVAPLRESDSCHLLTDDYSTRRHGIPFESVQGDLTIMLSDFAEHMQLSNLYRKTYLVPSAWGVPRVQTSRYHRWHIQTADLRAVGQTAHRSSRQVHRTATDRQPITRVTSLFMNRDLRPET